MTEKERNTVVLKAKAFDAIRNLTEDIWGSIDPTPDADNVRIAMLGAIYGVVVHTMDMIEASQNGE
jgi:hypothetical protein